MALAEDFYDSRASDYFFERTVQVDRFSTLMEATHSISDSSVRTIGGSAMAGYTAIAEEYETRLHEICQDFDYSMLFPVSYWKSGLFLEYKQWLTDHPEISEKQLRDLRHERNVALRTYASTILKQTSDGFEPISFDNSPFISSEDATSACAVGSFLMPFVALTQKETTTNFAAFGLEKGMKRNGRHLRNTKHIPDTDLLKIFLTGSFRELLPSKLNVEPIQFAGFTIDDLGQLVRAIRAKIPGSEIRAVLSVLSENALESDAILHQIVPLEMSPLTTVAHDTAHYGGPNKVFNSQKLLQRWYFAQGHGYLVVAKPSQD